MEQDRAVADIVNDQVERYGGLLPEVLTALLIFVFFLAIGWLIGRAVKAASARRGNRILGNLLARLPVLLFGFVGFMTAADALGLQSIANGLLAGGGATAIILGFAFREVGENLLAGVFLAFSRPFRIGDFVQSGANPEGTVKAVDLRNTHIRTTDGRDVFIPNARVFNEPLTNFTRDGLRRPTFTVGIDYQAPMAEVRAAILTAVSALPGVLATPAPRVQIVDFSAAYAVLEVQVWIDTFSGTDFAAVQTAAMDACRQAIVGNGWTISSEVTTAVELQHVAPPEANSR